MNRMDNKMDKSWRDALSGEFDKPYYEQLEEFLSKEYSENVIYPPMDCIFNAFHHTPLNEVKVVLLGQDPYHGEKQAHGLSFSVLPEQKTPKSLKNIYLELQSDMGCFIPNNGYLEKWANQGVLLLNTVLTVREHDANSHKNQGWEAFTDAVINVLNKQDKPIVFLLWGNHAQSKMPMLTNQKHLVLTAPHPSPFSAHKGFFGCKHFSRTNAFLRGNGETEIDWQIENI